MVRRLKKRHSAAYAFGIEGKVIRFLGSVVVSIVVGKYGRVEKTTPYFQIQMMSQGERMMDEEGFSVLEWHDPEFLIERMSGQGGADRKDLDESKIIETYVRSR